MIKIDGSYGEGGGQILRTALSLSAILNKPFQIYNIRKGRKKPGLLAQHLTGVNAAKVITKAKVTGNEFGSLSLTFEPMGINGGEYEFNVAEERGSAGAITLVAQTILPILFYADRESKVTLKGGTHVPFSPPFDYLKDILLPFAAELGFEAKVSLKQYGFYPVGGGEVVLEIKNQRKPIHSQSSSEFKTRGKLNGLSIISKIANLPASIAERQKNRLEQKLQKYLSTQPGCQLTEQCEVVKANCPGTYLFLTAAFQNIRAGFSALGEKGKPAERVGDEVGNQFEEYFESNGVFDSHLADQIITLLALNRKPTSFSTNKITNHLLTNIWVINQFLPEIKIEISGNNVVSLIPTK